MKKQFVPRIALLAAVLAAPTTTGFNRIAWIMPFAVLVAGFGLAVMLVRHWRAGTPPLGALPSIPENLRAQVRKETES